MNPRQIEKQQKLDYKDRDYDSDDDVKKDLLSFDEKLVFINDCDQKRFSSDGLKKRYPINADTEVVEQENVLPIVMHERELMENIENFVVTLVCGETGSGKST